MEVEAELGPGRKFRLNLVSQEGHLFGNGGLRFVLDDWPPYVDHTEFMSPVPTKPKIEGWFMYEIQDPKHLVTFSDGVHLYQCIVTEKEGDRVTLRVRTAANLLSIQKVPLFNNPPTT